MATPLIEVALQVSVHRRVSGPALSGRGQTLSVEGLPGYNTHGTRGGPDSIDVYSGDPRGGGEAASAVSTVIGEGGDGRVERDL